MQRAASGTLACETTGTAVLFPQGDGGGPANIAPAYLCNDGPAFVFKFQDKLSGIATIGGAMQYNTAYDFFGTPWARRPGKRQGSP